MRWGIACIACVLGCRSTHVSELPLVHDVRPEPSGLVVETCALRLEHTKDYTLWPALLFADLFLVFVNESVGLSIETWESPAARCRTDVLAGPP
jgi:hypothetical protein